MPIAAPTALRGLLILGTVLLSAGCSTSHGLDGADFAAKVELRAIQPPPGTIILERSGEGPADLGSITMTGRSNPGIQASCIGPGRSA
jgi:hypothetical protein